MATSDTADAPEQSDSFEWFEPSEIGLDDGEAERTAGFAVTRTGTRSDLRLRASELLAAVADLSDDCKAIVFVDASERDDELACRMVRSLTGLDAHASARYEPATQAVKRISGGLVVESVDRSTLGSLRAPEVLDRQALEQALRAVDASQLVGPTALVASAGGAIELYEGD